MNHTLAVFELTIDFAPNFPTLGANAATEARMTRQRTARSLDMLKEGGFDVGISCPYFPHKRTKRSLKTNPAECGIRSFSLFIGHN